MRLKELVVTPEQFQALLTQCSSTETFNNLTLKQQLASVPIKIVSPEEWARRALEDADILEKYESLRAGRSDFQETPLHKRFILGDFSASPDYFIDDTAPSLIRRLVQENGPTEQQLRAREISETINQAYLKAKSDNRGLQTSAARTLDALGGDF